MSRIPKLQTKDEYFKEEMAKDPQAATFSVMFAMAGASNTLTHKPSYNDQSEVSRKAYKDMDNMDFSEMRDYIDSLEQIADHWQEYAEHYYEHLRSEGYKFDDYDGYVLDEPPTPIRPPKRSKS